MGVSRIFLYQDLAYFSKNIVNIDIYWHCIFTIGSCKLQMGQKCNRLQLESILMDDKKVATLEQNSKNDYLSAI